jgi:hypothetical protein
MSNISSQFSPAGLSPRQNALSDAQFSSYVREQSVSAGESLNAGLTIKTKEGDVVTLTSGSYSQFDAYSYNSKGIVQTKQGTAVAEKNYREVTLTSGDTFSFSVAGDLNDKELEDIEAIVKGIDEVISEMTAGDMDQAVATAMTMGGYDTVSAYSADITYEKSFASQTRIEAQTQKEPDQTTEPSSENTAIPKAENPIPALEPFPENTRPWKKKNLTLKNIDKFVEKMTQKLEKYDEKLAGHAKDPVDKLFDHHHGKAKARGRGKNHSELNMIAQAKKQMEKMIDKLAGRAFENQLSAFS